ncbi:hypothetical protein DPMN_149770 [Dreissena polymorpha]|uniref:Uncharacterized protein n=1 Tax=Dreissena polymorpha TaxID=45954 RepID=A0A9D4FI09_DREPO|nr:hypothetical protein DPMN_149770 [Dreissena polymorpha]
MLVNASVTLSRIRATNELRLNLQRMTTKLSTFLGRYDFSTEHKDVSTDFDESTINMLEKEQGKVRTATDRRDLVRSAMNWYDQTTNLQRSGTIKYDATRISAIQLRTLIGLVQVSTN